MLSNKVQNYNVLSNEKENLMNIRNVLFEILCVTCQLFYEIQDYSFHIQRITIAITSIEAGLKTLSNLRVRGS